MTKQEKIQIILDARPLLNNSLWQFNGDEN